MTRLETPASVVAAPEVTRPSLLAVQKQLGVVPNLYRLLASSPAALEGFLALSSALGKGELDAKTRGRLALTVAELNGCDYCLSAHSYLGKNLLKLEDAEMTANREGRSTDARASAAVHFAAQVVRARGHVTDEDVQQVKAAGYSQAQILEIVLHTVVNTLTNYVNTVAKTEIDFPVVAHHPR